MTHSHGRAFVRLIWALLFVPGLLPGIQAADQPKLFRAGAAVIDITPTNFPVIVNAMFSRGGFPSGVVKAAMSKPPKSVAIAIFISSKAR